MSKLTLTDLFRVFLLRRWWRRRRRLLLWNDNTFQKKDTVGFLSIWLTIVKDPRSNGAPTGCEPEVSHVERLFGIFPTEKGICISLSSNLNNVLMEPNPETTVLFGADNVRRWLFSLIGPALVETNGWFLVTPSTDEDFNHGCHNFFAAEQRNMSVILAFDVECQRVPALALSFYWADQICFVVSGKYFWGNIDSFSKKKKNAIESLLYRESENKTVTSHCTMVNALKIWNSSDEPSRNSKLSYLQPVLCRNNNRITALKKAKTATRCHTTYLQAAESVKCNKFWTFSTYLVI